MRLRLQVRSAVSAHQNDRQRRLQPPQLVHQLGPGHVGHDHIAHHRVETLGSCAKHAKGLECAEASHRLVAERGQHFLREAHQALLVIDHQNRPAVAGRDRHGSRLLRGLALGERQKRTEGRPAPRVTVDLQSRCVVEDDSVHEGQAKARARAHGLGGKKRIEDPLDLGVGHAQPGIDDVDARVSRPQQVAHRAVALRVHFDRCGANDDAAGFADRLHRVGHEVGEHLVQLRRVSRDHDGFGRNLDGNRHPCGERCAGEAPHLGDDLLQRHRRAAAHPRATERQDAGDQVARALGGDDNVVDVAAQRASGFRVLDRKLAVAEHGAQHVVEIVGDAPG